MTKFLVLSLGFVCAGLIGCATNPNKAEKVNTKIENASAITGDEKLGVKDGNMIVQKKVMMNEELRRIQNEVYSLEDRVYGSRKYNSDGLYGVLKICRAKLSSKSLGGNGKLQFTERADRITDKEDEWTVGLDDKDKIVGVSEEFLKDRIARFAGYKNVLMKREDEYKDKLEVCDAEIAEREHDIAEKREARAQKRPETSTTTSSAPANPEGAVEVIEEKASE